MRLLHVGCGGDSHPAWLGTSFDEEVRLDIDPQHKPDIVASMTDMGDIGGFDALYSCHCVEHLQRHEVPVALAEFHRVLRPGGAAVIVVPDLEDVKADDEVRYMSPAGPVTGLDMMYGMARLIKLNPHMAHHIGFTSATLEAALKEAGFSRIHMMRAGGFNLIAAAVK